MIVSADLNIREFLFSFFGTINNSERRNTMRKHLKIVLCLAACLCLALAIDGTVTASVTRDMNSTEIIVTPSAETTPPAETTPSTETTPPAETTPSTVTTPPADDAPLAPPAVGDTVVVDGLKYKITSSKAATFIGLEKAKSLSSVTIPASITLGAKNAKDVSVLKVTAIGDKALTKDTKVVSVNIGKNVKTIGKAAFGGCTKLKTVKGGAAVTAIKDDAFSGCKALKNFPAMNKLQKIGANAFKGDKALATFTLAKTVTNIGKNAFNGCSGLKAIAVKTEKLTDKNVGAGAFKGINKKAVFKCPKKKLKEYAKLFVKKGAPKTSKFK